LGVEIRKGREGPGLVCEQDLRRQNRGGGESTIRTISRRRRNQKKGHVERTQDAQNPEDKTSNPNLGGVSRGKMKKTN